MQSPEEALSVMPDVGEIEPDRGRESFETEIAAFLDEHAESFREERLGAPCAVAAGAICIPACNEEEWIARCLTGFLAQCRPGDGIVLVVNDSLDDTLAIARSILREAVIPSRLVDLRWRPGHGSAPRARRLAMDLGRQLAPDGILFSSDADTVPLPGWRDAMAAEFARGVDAVCGLLHFDPDEVSRFPQADPAAEVLMRDYRAASHEIASRLDPNPDNPWPSHDNEGGANIAVTARAYARVGGLPLPDSSEDRALVTRLGAFDARVRYGEAGVVTSCRLEGRASGGLSEVLRHFLVDPDPFVDQRLEPPAALELRMRTRWRFRLARGTAERQEALGALDLDPVDLMRVLAAERTGAALEMAEGASPRLHRRRMRVSDLAREEAALMKLLERVRRDA